jgi:hypothetical protein
MTTGMRVTTVLLVGFFPIAGSAGSRGFGLGFADLGVVGVCVLSISSMCAYIETYDLTRTLLADRPEWSGEERRVRAKWI